MRKGRSSRRSRSSRPLIGSKAPPASVEALATEIGAANAKTPRVVVGISPSEPPPPETAESLIPPSVEAKGVVDVVTPAASSADRAAPLDPVAALEALEKTSVPPAASAEEPVATAEEKREALASTLLLGSAKAPDAPASEKDGVGAKADEQQEQGEPRAKPDLASTLAFGSSAKVDDAEVASTKGSVASTLVMGSPLADAVAPENVETPEKSATPEQTEPIATRPAEPVKVIEDPLPSPKLVAAEPVTPEKAKTEEAKGRDVTSGGKKNKKKGAAKGEAAKVAATDPDDVSVPPIGDIGVDEKFFSEGDISHHVSDAIEGDALTVLDKAKRKSEPHVVERRARFVRYVKWAVTGAALVCIAAVARTTMSSKAPVSVPSAAARGAAVVATAEAPPASPKAAASAAAPMVEPTAASTSTTTGTAAEPANANANAITAEPAVNAELANAPAVTAEPAANANANANANTPVVAAEPANAPAPAVTAEPANANATPETTPDVAAGDAKEAKAKARSSLEKRKIADAIEAGERSVKLDPTDGEAWLILGAAYQEKGNIAEARRAYSSCVKEGKTGPRTECAKMLR